MNWVGDLVQKLLKPTDTVVDLGCGVMQSTLDTCPSYPPTRIQCAYLLGIDIFRNYLVFLKDRGIPVLRADVSWILPLADKSFDAALLLDIIEHLPFDLAFILLMEAERIARRKVIVLTPSRFQSNLDAITYDEVPYAGLGANPYQEHKNVMTADILRRQGYTVYLGHSGWKGIKSYFAVKKLDMH